MNVPALQPLPDPRSEPSFNAEIEAALLGAILINNPAYESVMEFLCADHFHEPVHGRIYEAAGRLIDEGREATPRTLQLLFAKDEALADVDGGRYLYDLAASTIGVSNVADYGRQILDLWKRRELILLCDATRDAAEAHSLDIDAVGIIDELEERLTALVDREQADTSRSLGESARVAAEEIEVACAAGRGITGLSTGLIDLDRILAGMHNGDLILLAGRPSMGKSALAGKIALEVAKGRDTDKDSAQPVLFFSLEMSHEQVTKRLIAAEAGIGFERLRNGTLDNYERGAIREAAAGLGRWPLTIDYSPAMTVQRLRARARRHKRRRGLALIVVDYLQLLTASAEARRKNNDTSEATEISRNLKAVARELDVPLLCLSQLSRQVESREDKRPGLADLRQSGALEQDADVVGFIYRDEYYARRAEPLRGQFKSDDAFDAAFVRWSIRMSAARNRADIIIAKQRQGPTGAVRLFADMSLMRFDNLDDSRQEGVAI